MSMVSTRISKLVLNDQSLFSSPSEITSVTVTGARIQHGSPGRNHSDVHVAYIIRVKADGKVWEVCRRFRQFAEFHVTTVNEKGINVSSFPSKIVYDKTSPGVVEYRKKVFHKYLNDLLLNEDIRESNAFRMFLGAEIRNDYELTQFPWAFRSA